MKNSVSCPILLILAAVILSVAAFGQEAAREAGVWRLEEVKAFHTPKDQMNPLSPWNCKALNGEATSEIVLGHLNPPGRQKVRVKWTQPPKAMTPGEVVRLGLSAEMLANDVRGAAYISCHVVADIEGSDMAPWQVSREGRVRFVEGEKRRIELTEKTALGTVVRLDAQATAPPFGVLGSRETGKIQLRVIIVHQYLLAFQYIYKWVPQPQSGETAAAKPTPPTKPVESPHVVPPAPPSGAATKSGPMSGGFPKDALPPAIEEKTEVVPAQGGIVALPGGAKLTIPPGAVKQDVKIAFRKLPTTQKDCALYHIESSVETLDVPAELQFPLPVEPPAEGKDYAVEVLLVHNQSDPGRRLPIESASGERSVRAKTKEMSLILVSVIWGTAWIPIISEDYLKTVNSYASLLKAVEEAKAETQAKTGKTDILLRVPYYVKGKTMWCWAASLAMLTHATGGVDRQLKNPVKPQVIASVVGANTEDGLGAWRFWPGNGPNLQPFAYMSEATGDSDVEAFRWLHYEGFVHYLFDSLAAGYPVMVDMQSQNHSVVVVGYDANGFWVQDNDKPIPPVRHLNWMKFFELVKDTSVQLIRGVNTAVIKRKAEVESPLSINVPTCRQAGQMGAEWNHHGCYFTTPHNQADDCKHAGFMWDGYYPDGRGMKLVTGGEKTTHVNPLEVGARTALGFRFVEITNVSDAKAKCWLRIGLVDAEDNQEIVVMKDTSYEVPAVKVDNETVKGRGGRLLWGTMSDIPILPLLSTEEKKRGIRKYVLRLSLISADEREMDRVDLPVALHPLRIDDITVNDGDQATDYRLTGSGFDMKGVQAVLVMGANRHVSLNQIKVEPAAELNVKSPQEASFSLPEKLQPLAIYLRAESGLESNAYPIVGKPFKLTLEHEGGAALGPGNNVLKVTCKGALTGPAGTTATARPLFMHNAQLLDVFASAGWEEPVQIDLNVQYSLSAGMKWQWDCTVEGHNGAAFGQTILTNPRLEVIPNSPHANCKSTQTPPVLNVFVPPGPRLAALSGTGNVPQQFSGLVALVFDKKVRIYRIEPERDGSGKVVGTKNEFAREATEKFEKDQGVTARIYLLHFQVDRNP
ncbi:MAG: C39 family peptidase [Planctomycetota bacterium]